MTERAVEAAAANGDGAEGEAPLLDIRNLVKEYPVTSGAILQRKVAAVHAVSDVSFSVCPSRPRSGPRRASLSGASCPAR